MNRIDRLFGMLTLLQSRKFVPAESIARKFNISVRTVYRDIRALGEQGIPVSFEQYRGYFIVPGYFLPPVSFSTEEANALLIMESMVGAFADQSIQKHYSNALNKVKAVLKNSQKEKMEALNNMIRLQVPDCFRHNFEYLSDIQGAISSRHVLQIEYQGNKGETTLRSLEPIGLVFYALNWHLIGWCHKRSDYRDFRVSRILKLRDTGSGFKKTDHISLNDYMKKLPVNY
jgi:predicted DNA-binding transcriptional regulator YafY